eukprot:gene15562-25784_t
MLTTMRADNVRIAAMVGLGSYLLYKVWCAASPAPSPTPQQLPYTCPTDSDTNRNGELLSRSILWLKKELPVAFPSATFTAPLSPGTPFGGFGCKLHGIDLSANNGRLTASQAAFLVEALPRFRVLTIADQNVGDAAVATRHSNLSSESEGFTLQHFERFASHFGALVPHPNNLLRGGKQALTGLRRLEKQETEVFRGVPVPFSKLDDKDHYVAGSSAPVVWWPFSSSTTSRKVASQFALDASGKGTLFKIKVATARDIQPFSAIQKEFELLMLPGTPLKVVSVTTAAGLTTIVLEEDVDAPDMVNSGDDTYEFVELFKAKSFYEVVTPGVYDLVGDFIKPPSKAKQLLPPVTSYENVVGDFIKPPSKAKQPLPPVTSPLKAKIKAHKSEWFYDTFGRAQAEEYLSRQPKGSFLLRPSSKKRDPEEEQAVADSTRDQPYYAFTVKEYSRSDPFILANPGHTLFWNGLMEENDSKTRYFLNLGPDPDHPDEGDEILRWNSLEDFIFALMTEQAIRAKIGLPVALRLG